VALQIAGKATSKRSVGIQRFTGKLRGWIGRAFIGIISFYGAVVSQMGVWRPMFRQY
jgi:hypothetical protein